MAIHNVIMPICIDPKTRSMSRQSKKLIKTIICSFTVGRQNPNTPLLSFLDGIPSIGHSANNPFGSISRPDTKYLIIGEPQLKRLGPSRRVSEAAAAWQEP